MTTVHIHPLALIGVADQTARGQDSPFGVLLGHKTENAIVVATSFDLKYGNGSLDLEFFHRKLTLTKAVLPQLEFLGIYEITADINHTASMAAAAKQLNSDWLLNIAFSDSNSTNIFRAYLRGSTTPVRAVVVTNETEAIATSTIINHRHYTDDKQASEEANNDGLVLSVEQLQQKVAKIIAYQPQNTEESFEIERMIAYLANKVAAFKNLTECDADYNHQLHTSHLSVLTSQSAALDGLKSQISKNVIKHGMNARAQSRIQ